MSQLMADLKAKVALLARELEQYAVLAQAEEAIGLPRLYIAAAAATLGLALARLLAGARALTNALAAGVPAYRTFKLLRGDAPTPGSDPKTLLTFWLLFSSVDVVEAMHKNLRGLLGPSLPGAGSLYYPAKVLFFVACAVPKFKLLERLGQALLSLKQHAGPHARVLVAKIMETAKALSPRKKALSVDTFKGAGEEGDDEQGELKPLLTPSAEPADAAAPTEADKKESGDSDMSLGAAPLVTPNVRGSPRLRTPAGLQTASEQ